MTPPPAAAALAHGSDAYHALMLVVREADEAFQKAGDAGTKTWLDDYFLPALAASGWQVTRRDEGLDIEALRTAFHDVRWCKDAARGHAFAHGDDPEDDAARQAFADAYRAALASGEEGQ